MNISAARKVLIVRLGSMGDIVHTLPAAAALKDTFPACQVDWLVENRWRGLLERNPCIHHVVTVNTPGWRKNPLSPASWSVLGEVIQQLRGARYDIALDFQGAIKSAVACVLSGATETWGFERPWLKEPACSVLYTHRVPANAVHIVDANLALAAAVGADTSRVRFPLPEVRDAPLPANDASGIAVLNPGAGWRSKQWAAENYAALCDALAEETGMRAYLNCGPGEEGLAQEVHDRCRTANPRVYSSDLTGLMALLRQSRLAVGADTGPIHLAAAMGVPTVALFGPTDPRRNGPYGPRVRWIRPPSAVTSYRHSGHEDAAMRSIRPDEVLESIRELLRQEKESTPSAATTSGAGGVR